MALVPTSSTPAQPSNDPSGPPQKSANLVAWALNAPIRRASAKLVLVALAAACADGGAYRVTIGHLALVAATERRAVQRHLAKLEADGWVKRRRIPGRASVFTVADPLGELSTGETLAVERSPNYAIRPPCTANIGLFTGP